VCNVTRAVSVGRRDERKGEVRGELIGRLF